MKSAVICCGRCEYRYCCSDGTARLDQGTCSDSDPDRTLPSKAEVVADEFSTGDYPVYIPFLIVGSAFLALLLFGSSACFLYNRQTSSTSDSVAIGTTTTTTTTTTASCSSSATLCPPSIHGDRIHGDQPRCRGDSCHVQRLCRDGQPVGGSAWPASAQSSQPDRQPRPCPPLTPTPTLVMAPSSQHGFTPPVPTLARSQAQHSAPHATDQQLTVSYPQHFNTHPQSSSYSRAACSAQYATMPRPGSPAHDTPLGPLPKLPISPQQLPPGALFPGSLLCGYILQSQTTAALTPAAYRQHRIPSPPPSLTLTHHPPL
ncbi:hypothetical protein AALO_G00031440 [Alosa alosa]|uniref:Shisa N-terminal domain-containing protein n=1 Tax=Alosa alosa TaxID=278164 RepID=A0AAV6HHC1_9TELE|nr:hypothetical protein AALO_G00031440 [Alosa alosa]